LEILENLGRSYDSLFLCLDLGQSLVEKGVAVVLAGRRLGDGFLSGGKLIGELGAVAPVRLPRHENGGGQEGGYENFCEA
jgi:hypothetical protein